MKIKRAEILRAIRNEPLSNGHWIKPEGYDEFGYEAGEKYNDKCAVCAVGAVLRTKGVPNNKIAERASDFFCAETVDNTGDEMIALEEKNYLLALSVKFEKLAERLGAGKRTRDQLALFVKKNFPKEIRVKI